MPSLPPSKYPPNTTNTIPARSGVAVPLKQNQRIKIINTHGSQVVDTWAVVPSDGSYVSMCHTRAKNLHLTPLPGDLLVNTRRVPVLRFSEDTTSTGVHDTLIAACHVERYHELGVPETEYHDNCADNFRNGLARDIPVTADLDLTKFQPSPPDPLNLFMNIPVEMRQHSSGASLSAGGTLSFEPPVSKPGDYVVLEALQDCIVVMSACPQDILRINNQNPTDAHFIIE